MRINKLVSTRVNNAVHDAGDLSTSANSREPCGGWAPRARARRVIVLPITGLLLATFHCNCARAEVHVRAEGGDIRVEARDATVAEILAALGERFALRLHGTPATRSVTATFEGSLRRVVARVLDGYDYVIEARDNGLYVIVVGTHSPKAVPPPPIAPPTAPSRRQRDN